jgi:enoyl-CoA hydratase/carnithine racemase
MIEDTQDGVRTVTIRRDPMNTLDLAAVERLSTLFENHPPDLPLVLEGSEGVFSAGVDAKQFMKYDRAQRTQMARAITRMTAYLLRIPAPVVASIPGHALGGGLVLALCCDYRIATNAEQAKFGLLEAKAGIAFPDGPAHIVQSELPATLLRQLTMSSRSMSAADLMRHGVFDETTDPDRLSALANNRARELAGQPGFSAVKAQMRGALADRVHQLANEGRESAFT